MNFYAGQLVNILPCYGKITTESLAKALDTGKVIFEYLTTDYVSRTKYAKVSECVIKDPDGEWYSLATFLDALNLKLYSPLKLWDIATIKTPGRITRFCDKGKLEVEFRMKLQNNATEVECRQFEGYELELR